MEAYQYEYTPGFIYSNTVQQASAACYDYFKWGDYLQPTGNDFAECGWADRNYYGAAMATSIGILNKYPNAYAAFWGMPKEVAERKHAINSAFGASATQTIREITENVHRDAEVLILYPLSLVAAEQRFGSWMTQFAYANYITTEKLLELGKVNPDGSIQLAGRRFTTLVAMFEIAPQPGLFDMMKQLGEAGGRVIWFGPPPVIDGKGKNCLDRWNALFGVDYNPSIHMGQMAAGKVITFRNSFKNIPSQNILTEFLVDRVYPVKIDKGSELLADVDGLSIGSVKKTGKGAFYFMGFRPRDDQSESLGYETGTMFSILAQVGAYPQTGKFKEVNDNTEYISRTTDYFTTRFPNGTTVIVRHYKTHRENWLDGFSRNDSIDAVALGENPLPSNQILLQDFKVNGHEISFTGALITAINTDASGQLIAFEGHDCKQVKVDGKLYKISEMNQPTIVWVQANAEEQTSINAVQKVFVVGSGKVNIPIHPGLSSIKVIGDPKGDEKPADISFTRKGAIITLDINAETSGKWLYICKR